MYARRWASGLDVVEKRENDHNHEDEAKEAGRSIAPASARVPAHGREAAEEEEDQDDDDDQGHGGGTHGKRGGSDWCPSDDLNAIHRVTRTVHHLNT